MRVLGLLGRFRGRFRRLPLAGGWTATRDLPAPAGDVHGGLGEAAGGEPMMSAGVKS